MAKKIAKLKEREQDLTTKEIGMTNSNKAISAKERELNELVLLAKQKNALLQERISSVSIIYSIL